MVRADTNDAHLAVAGKTVADNLLQATVQVGHCALLVKVFQRHVDLLHYLVLFQSDVLATQLFKGEKCHHVGIKEALHDLAEEVSQLQRDIRPINDHVLLILRQDEDTTVNKEIDALDELFLVEFNVVKVFILHQLREFLCLDIQFGKVKRIRVCCLD